jgi:hypothetical protein
MVIGSGCSGIIISNEVLLAMIAKNMGFWDVTPYSLAEKYQQFGETCYLHLLNRTEEERDDISSNSNI